MEIFRLRLLPLLFGLLTVLTGTSTGQHRPSAPPMQRTASHRGLSVDSRSPRTVNVLALRIQFKLENPDNPATTGNGRFDLTAPAADRTIDLPPHNKRYFEDQLLGMRNYFLDVSDSNLTIEYTVVPDGDTDAVTLDTFMSYYGILGTQEQRDVRLAEFFYDAVTGADQTGTIDFSAYDYVVVFHAGVGQDFSREDNTPNDLSSRFVSLDLLRKKYGSTFEGVPVTGGVVAGGVVVPETESQSLIDPLFGGDVFTEIGLMGVLVSNFGSQLGMPDLFNTETGRTGIGVFGLEDQGAVNGDGLIPAEPDPWTKIFMGWAQPTVVTDSVDLALLPKKLAGRSTILKVPINASEYFLIENRQRNVLPDEALDVVISRIDTINNQDGSVTIDTAYLAGARRSSVSGVLTQIDEYDAGLPGSGVLIWHIDENIIASRLKTNSINNDDFRGVRLVEASGAQEIGFTFGGGPFITIETGNRFDFFYRGNEAFAFYNGNVDSVFFTPTSVPNSRSNRRINSGIFVTGFSPLQPVMQFSVRTSLMKEGFPVFSGSTFGRNALAVGDLTGDGRPEVVAVGEDGKVFAWTAAAGKVIPNAYTRTAYGLGGDSTIFDVALFAETGDSVYQSPALADLDGDGKAEVIVTDRSGTLYAWKAQDQNGDGRADTLFVRPGLSPITAGPLIAPGLQIVTGGEDGIIRIWQSNGSPGGIFQAAGEVRALALSGSDTMAYVTTESTGWFQLSTLGAVGSESPNGSSLAFALSADLNQDGILHSVFAGSEAESATLVSFPGPEPGWPFSVGDRIESALSAADVDGDGFLEIVFGGRNRIYAFNHNGTTATGFPAVLDATASAGAVGGTVVIGDVDGDGKPDLVAPASDGHVYAVDGSGKPLADFTRATGKPVSAGPALVDLEGDGRLDLAAAAEDGFLYAWELPGRNNAGSVRWGQYARDAARTAWSTEQNTISPPGDDLMPGKSVYNYPNPVRGIATRIRYYLSEAATVRIRIFDMAGDLVTTLEGPGLAQTDNEQLWNVSRVQSGVYFAKVEARGVSGRKVTRTIKIAIAR